MQSPPLEEEGAREAKGDELTTAPIPHPPVPLSRGGRDVRSEAEPREERGVGQRCFKVGFILHYPTLI